MELFLTIPNRINFLQMGRFGRSSEQRFRMNFRKKLDWISFNRTLVQGGNPNRRATAIDPSYICKSGKKTPGVGYFWSGCASAVKWGLEREIKVVIADYIDSDKKTQSRKVFLSTDTGMNSKDIFDVYRTRFHIEFLYCDSKQFTGLCNCQSRDVKAMDFAFNMSLSTINVAGQFGKEYDVDLSVSDVKMLLHNAAMVERIFSTFGKSPNLMKNNTDFKELLFYGLRAAI